MTATRLLVILVAIGCAALVGLQLAGHAGISALAKLVASTAFVALAVTRGATTYLYGRLMLAGLVLSWLTNSLLSMLQQWKINKAVEGT